MDPESSLKNNILFKENEGIKEFTFANKVEGAHAITLSKASFNSNYELIESIVGFYKISKDDYQAIETTSYQELLNTLDNRTVEYCDIDRYVNKKHHIFHTENNQTFPIGMGPTMFIDLVTSDNNNTIDQMNTFLLSYNTTRFNPSPTPFKQIEEKTKNQEEFKPQFKVIKKIA